MRQNKAPRLPSKRAYREVAAALDVPASGYKPKTYPVTLPKKLRRTATTPQGEGEATQTLLGPPKSTWGFTGNLSQAYRAGWESARHGEGLRRMPSKYSSRWRAAWRQGWRDFDQMYQRAITEAKRQRSSADLASENGENCDDTSSNH